MIGVRYDVALSNLGTGVYLSTHLFSPYKSDGSSLAFSYKSIKEFIEERVLDMEGYELQSSALGAVHYRNFNSLFGMGTEYGAMDRGNGIDRLYLVGSYFAVLKRRIDGISFLLPIEYHLEYSFPYNFLCQVSELVLKYYTIDALYSSGTCLILGNTLRGRIAIHRVVDYFRGNSEYVLFSCPTLMNVPLQSVSAKYWWSATAQWNGIVNVSRLVDKFHEDLERMSVGTRLEVRKGRLKYTIIKCSFKDGECWCYSDGSRVYNLDEVDLWWLWDRYGDLK